MNVRVPAIGIAFFAVAAMATSAWAGESKIVDTGIAEFDDVFAKARDIQGSVQTQNQTMVEGRTNVNTAMGVAADAPLKTALEDLKTKANGKIKILMEGNVPKLQASEAVPENVQKGMDSVNALSDTSGKTSDTADQLLPQSEALVEATKDFPGKVPGLVKNPLDVAKKSKLVDKNVKAVATLPDKVKALKTEAQGVFADVTAVFGG
ncbi:MAG: hypothetical protein U1F43_39240 [Myxococcota bacterium]